MLLITAFLYRVFNRNLGPLRDNFFVHKALKYFSNNLNSPFARSVSNNFFYKQLKYLPLLEHETPENLCITFMRMLRGDLVQNHSTFSAGSYFP